MKRWVFLAILFCAFLLRGQTLENLLEKKGRSLFGTQRNQLMQLLGMKRLIKDNEDETQLRYSQDLGETLTFGGVEIVEAIFEFDKRHELFRMSISLYNRGDCGVWDNKRFNQVLNQQKAAISSLKRASDPQHSSRFLAGEKVSQMLWFFPGYCIALRWSAGEYITLLFTEKNEMASIQSELKTDVQSKDLRRNIRRTVGGDRFISVPMVAQGDKGYCFSAAVARLLKYYNSSVDLHIAAQILDTTTSGTSLTSALEGLEKNAQKLKLRVNLVYADKTLHEVSKFEKFMQDYNRVAKKQKVDTLPKEEMREFSRYPDVAHFISLMDRKLFLGLRGERKPGKEALLKTVKEEIDAGRPLIWSVVILKDGETTFHARLINGYNESHQKIFFTDSWGAGFEKEEMSLSEAWAITTEVIKARPL